MTGFPPSHPVSVSWLQVFARVTSAWALLLGGVMALAWVFVALFPQAQRLDVATLSPHTALGFVLAGVALWLKQVEAVAGQGEARKRVIANLCAASLVLTGLLTLGRHVFGFGLHADRILTGEVFRVLQTPTLGRMEINTALNSIFLGTALVLMTVETRRGIRPAQLLALGAGLVSLLGIIGYVDGARPQHGTAGYLLGLANAATFAALSIGVLLTHPHRGLMQVIMSRGVGGVVARRFLIYVLVITVLLAALDQAGERLGLYKSRLDSLLFILSINGLLTILIWMHARSLNRGDVIRHEAKAKIERSQAMLVQAEQLAHLGSWEWDLQTRQFNCSEEMDRIFGLTGEKLGGGYDAYLERIHAEDRERVRALFEGALPEGKSFAKNVHVLMPAGLRRIVALHTRALADTWGRPASILGACLDVTDFVRSADELWASREQLRALSARLQRAREEERTHVAREIHDELGQVLTALKMDVSLLAEQVRPEPDGAPGRWAKELESMINLIDRLIGSVQDIATQLRPMMLDELGLLAAIEWQAKEFQDRFRIRCVVRAAGEDWKLDRDQATTVFRVFQEILTNIARHARATKILVKLQREEKSLCLQVRDNGRGAGKDEVSDAKSLGILGMRERAMLVGGALRIRGREGQGTVVSLRVPLGGAGSPAGPGAA